MTEWGVVGVIIALVGLIAGIVTPLLKLNTSIVKLTMLVDGLSQRLAGIESNNTDAHRRLWTTVDEHTHELAEHDKRISHLEDR